MKRKFIAYGAGVGSTALLYRNLDSIRNGNIEVIYSDHQCDLPESRSYPKIISDALDIDITILTPGSLYDYCYKRKILPSIHWRWCTDKFKIRPMRRYVDGDIPIIGLTLDEKRRAHDFAFNGRSNFPLIDNGITRNNALSMITDQKPCKSGCYFCPFQKKTTMDRTI
jgi:3'-phosphoadenosine 5'-phosphosulfate sulfotransferase (PAPS reductase)/FAD synthetase